jgi:hypothetical protein
VEEILQHHTFVPPSLFTQETVTHLHSCVSQVVVMDIPRHIDETSPLRKEYCTLSTKRLFQVEYEHLALTVKNSSS